MTNRASFSASVSRSKKGNRSSVAVYSPPPSSFTERFDRFFALTEFKDASVTSASFVGDHRYDRFLFIWRLLCFLLLIITLIYRARLWQFMPDPFYLTNWNFMINIVFTALGTYQSFRWMQHTKQLTPAQLHSVMMASVEASEAAVLALANHVSSSSILSASDSSRISSPSSSSTSTPISDALPSSPSISASSLPSPPSPISSSSSSANETPPSPSSSSSSSSTVILPISALAADDIPAGFAPLPFDWICRLQIFHQEMTFCWVQFIVPIYWFLEYEPAFVASTGLLYVNVVTHGIVWIIPVVDFMLNRICVKFIHFLYQFCFSVLYLFLNYVAYLYCGPLYKALDWSKISSSILFSFAGVVVGIAALAVLRAIMRLRPYVYDYFLPAEDDPAFPDYFHSHATVVPASASTNVAVVPRS